MLEFREPRPEDGVWIRELLSLSNYNNSEYSVGVTYMWRHMLSKRIARYKDFLLVKTNLRGGSYLFPAGKGDWVEALELLSEDAARDGQPLRLYSATPEIVDTLNTRDEGRFAFEPIRAAVDYVYSSADLIELSGRKYHGKRNHIARFEANYPDWSYEDITPENLGECRDMFVDWLETNGDKKDIEDEVDALRDVFDHFELLGFSGGLIRAEGRVVAFTMGEPLTDDCYVLHFEKAYAGVQGAYPSINREFAARRLSGYPLINREEDMDIPGLRRSKLSYQPVKLIEKGYVLFGEKA